MSTIKKHYGRILEISDDHKQITLPDGRYYQRNGEYYPSVTYVLSHYPKGTQVHEMIEAYLNGEELKFLEHGIPMYDPNVWQMFLRFVDWWEEYKPTLIEAEVHLFSDELKVAGTCDLVCEINGELWVIDFKTSNHLQTTYDLQTAIYAQCFEECFGKKIDRTGVLWLKSSKRGPKKGKIQGKGWEVYESSRSQEENLNIYRAVRQLFDIENPKHKPAFTEFRTTAKRNL